MSVEKLAKRFGEMREEENAREPKPQTGREQVDVIDAAIRVSADLAMSGADPIARRKALRELTPGMTVTGEGATKTRKKFAELSDEELQRIDSSKLNGVALDAYVAELDRRMGRTEAVVDGLEEPALEETSWGFSPREESLGVDEFSDDDTDFGFGVALPWEPWFDDDDYEEDR